VIASDVSAGIPLRMWRAARLECSPQIAAYPHLFGALLTCPFPPPPCPCAQITGDGLMDVVSASHQRSEVVVHRNMGGSPPTWSLERIAAFAASAVYAVDVSGDHWGCAWCNGLLGRRGPVWHFTPRP
jgi:hypothetical protein